MCSFPASGSSWKSFAREGVAMDDPGCRQGVTLSERGELVPKEPTPASPPRQPFLPNPNIFLHHVLDEWFEVEVRPRLTGRFAAAPDESAGDLVEPLAFLLAK